MNPSPLLQTASSSSPASTARSPTSWAAPRARSTTPSPTSARPPRRSPSAAAGTTAERTPAAQTPATPTAAAPPAGSRRTYSRNLCPIFYKIGTDTEKSVWRPIRTAGPPMPFPIDDLDSVESSNNVVATPRVVRNQCAV